MDTAAGRMRLGKPAAGALDRLCLSLAIAVFLLVPHAGSAQPIAGDIHAVAAQGYARVEFRLKADVGASARLANNILVLHFEQPVAVPLDRLASALPDYVGAVRRDPDGRAIRIGLTRKLTFVLTPAGERIFLDLLPDGWSGPPPRLPDEVVEELARRAREAEQRARRRQQAERWRTAPPVRVRLVQMPTFTRYAFPLPADIAVTSARNGEQLVLTFDAPLRVDLADTVAARPSYVEGIEARADEDGTAVRFTFGAKVDLRSFRDDDDYVVDVTPVEARPARADAAGRMVEAALRASAAGAALPLPPRPSPTPPAASPPQTVPPTDAERPSLAAPAASSAPVPPPRASPHAQSAARTSPASVRIEMHRIGDKLRLHVPFRTPTPAAVFRRADTVWLVFDTDEPIALDGLPPQGDGLLRGAVLAGADGRAVRLTLDRPRLVSVTAEGPGWTITIGESAEHRGGVIALDRAILGTSRASVIAALAGAARLHRLVDPDSGTVLYAVTAPAPVRGLPKAQEFVDFHALASAHGLVVQPLADDLHLQLAPDKVLIGRPGGLTLSAWSPGMPRAQGVPAVLDPQQWAKDRDADHFARQSELLTTAALAAPEHQAEARLALARFYLAKGLCFEAKGAIDAALASPNAKTDEAAMHVLRAIANVLGGRPAEALADLAQPEVGNQFDAPLWRAVAQADQGKWAAAREGFGSTDMAIGALPIELQRQILQRMVRAAIELGDFETAANQLNDFETIGTPPEWQGLIAILRGQIAEGLGRTAEALAAYRSAAESGDRHAEAIARLRETKLRHASGTMSRPDAIAALETISAIWRGDDTELAALQMLARLYIEEGRLREAYMVMRTALGTHSASDLTRRIQDEAAASFEALFLAGTGEQLSAIDALSLFYDFRELTPMGRRGDELIRRLAERLVAIDLLDQAAELLQHQVDHRLHGAARAQVAARLATIYLMNRKPERALAALQRTRIAELAETLRRQRLMLEARALAELGRIELALEVIANLGGSEVERLRADILWLGRHWLAAAEQIERYLGERWRDFRPLDAFERTAVLRAALGYALAEDRLGSERLRDRYGPKMAGTPDARAFAVAVGGSAGSPEFRAVAAAVAAIDTLDEFLRRLQSAGTDAAAGLAPGATAADRTAEHARGPAAPARRHQPPPRDGG